MIKELFSGVEPMNIEDFTQEEIELFENPEKWEKWEHDNLDIPMYKAVGLVLGIYVLWEVIYTIIF